MEKALKGVKVIDLTQAMSGPFASMLLGDLGAEVIKVEPLDGDQTRKWAPPYMANISSYFMSANRNKKSIAIDLKTPEGKDILKKLVKTGDVLIENFRPGVIGKLGFAYDDVKQYNKSIIYCSISGYGQKGPLSGYPGYDLTVLAMSGLLGITGNPGSPPVKFGVPIADITTALFATISILSALYYRQQSGMGQYIDLSMLDCNFLALSHQLMSYLSTGNEPQKLGSAHASIAPYQAYKTKDSYIVITVGTEKLWGKFCDVLAPSLSNRLEFKTNIERISNRLMLENELNKILGNKTTQEVYSILVKNGIPCAPVNTVAEAVESKQVTSSHD
ncbi:MAG: CoA transferase [Ferroplasma sp.]